MTKKPEMRSDSDEIWVLDFTPETAQEFRDKLFAQSAENPSKPIIIYIDSYGGQVDALAKMVATLDEVSNPIVTACIGKAMSCGAILLSHGDLRFCDIHSRIMIHKVSGATGGDAEDIQNDATEITRLNKYWLEFLAVNCNIKGGYHELERHIKSKDGRDRYMTADEAKKLGIIDSIGIPKISSTIIHEVVHAPTKMPIKKRAAVRAAHMSNRNPVKPKKSRSTKDVKRKPK